MNEYLFYTTEGFTIAPNTEEEVDNCQILGFVKARSLAEAKNLLLQDNPWIVKAGFSVSEILVKQVVPVQ